MSFGNKKAGSYGGVGFEVGDSSKTSYIVPTYIWSFVCNENVPYRELCVFYILCVNCLNVLIELGVFPVTSQILEFDSVTSV